MINYYDKLFTLSCKTEKNYRNGTTLQVGYVRFFNLTLYAWEIQYKKGMFCWKVEAPILVYQYIIHILCAFTFNSLSGQNIAKSYLLEEWQKYLVKRYTTSGIGLWYVSSILIHSGRVQKWLRKILLISDRQLTRKI